LRITVHRGAREIGGNCVEVHHGGSSILLDLGMPLFDKNRKQLDTRALSRLSVRDLASQGILPRIAGVFSHEPAGAPGVLGVFLSHAHADHHGLCEYLRDDIPVFLGEGARKMIDLGRVVNGRPPLRNRRNPLMDGTAVEVGPFRVTPLLVDHSVFESFAFVVEAGGKSVIYTGDFRDHGRKKGMLARFLREAPKEADALLIEGTLAGGKNPDRSKLEKKVEEELIATFRSSPGYVFVATSSQNTDRIVSLYRAVLRTGRLLVLDVHTASILAALKNQAKIPHPSKEYDRIRVYFSSRIATRYAENAGEESLYRFLPYKITREKMAENPDRIVMMLKSSMIRDAELLSCVEGSTLVWSLWNGYLREKSAEKMLRFVKSHRIRMVHHHTGGHANQETLFHVERTLRPKRVIPIHTFHPEALINAGNNIVVPDNLYPIYL